MARHTLPGAAAALATAGAVGVVTLVGSADAAALTRRYGPPPRLPATYFIAADGDLRGVAGGYLSPGGLTAALAARGGGADVTLAAALLAAAAAAAATSASSSAGRDKAADGGRGEGEEEDVAARGDGAPVAFPAAEAAGATSEDARTGDSPASTDAVAATATADARTPPPAAGIGGDVASASRTQVGPLGGGDGDGGSSPPTEPADPLPPPTAAAGVVIAAAPSAARAMHLGGTAGVAAPAATVARLALRLPDGTTVRDTFSSATRLVTAREALLPPSARGGGDGVRLSTAFPRVFFSAADDEKTLAELGLVPSAVLVATPLDAIGDGGGGGVGGGVGPAGGLAAAVGGAASAAATGVATAAATVGGWFGWAAARIGGGGGGGGGGSVPQGGGAAVAGGVNTGGPRPPPSGGGREMRQLPIGGLRHRPTTVDGDDDGSMDYWNGNGTTFGSRDTADGDPDDDADATRRGGGRGAGRR
ncbi:hypothetical protein MMPV_003919 [Pyropia vietnamensis]